eukprot:g74771.t1
MSTLVKVRVMQSEPPTRCSSVSVMPRTASTFTDVRHLKIMMQAVEDSHVCHHCSDFYIVTDPNVPTQRPLSCGHHSSSSLVQPVCTPSQSLVWTSPLSTDSGTLEQVTGGCSDSPFNQ